MASTDQAHSTRFAFLDKLAEELGNRGLQAWIVHHEGFVPCVEIVNPCAQTIEERVYVSQGKDGMWWFWWPWPERISVADDLDAAATSVTRVMSLPTRD
jgi:hypothetical protein